MAGINFRRLTIADKALVQSFTFKLRLQICDLNFMNLCSWQFLYDTELAVIGDWLVFRFYADGHLAYMLPCGGGFPRDILTLLLEDSRQLGHPFLMLGVCEDFVPCIGRAMPGTFHFSHNRDYSDYIYDRNALSTLAGKALQAKRNHVNRFLAAYPDYEFRHLTQQEIPLCRELELRWQHDKQGTNPVAEAYENERRSMNFVFDHWDELDSMGGCLFVNNRLVAFTFGSKINENSFNVCVEKADIRYEGAYAVINRDFVRSLPPEYLYINREEDLGINGLRQAKSSYRPLRLLHKYSVTELEPLKNGIEYFKDFKRVGRSADKRQQSDDFTSRNPHE